MKSRSNIIGKLFLGILIFTAACGGGVDEASVGMSQNYDELVADLRANGGKVDANGTVSQPFFVPEGQVIQIDGEDVQVFEFTNAADAQAAVETISPDGGSIGTTMASWMATPHFFHAGKLIVLYVGDMPQTTASLKEVLGEQIAGR
ncbi:MAG: hypothetical protein N2D54_09020 [Chloroflexota bacterium]